MTIPRTIRIRVFGRISQAEMARIAGVTQATVSRWESGAGEPCLTELTRIRAEALRRGLPWQDSWFFGDEPPEEVAA